MEDNKQVLREPCLAHPGDRGVMEEDNSNLLPHDLMEFAIENF